MKFSESWLREWVNPAVSTDELLEQLTMAGLEIDGVEAAAGAFTGVVVGEIIAIEQHPDADKLRVCQVAGLIGESGGAQLTQVVCGAANARTGIKIPFATVGAVLPPGPDGKPFKIKKAKLRGVESFGMLCGQTELECGDDDSGLWELPQDAVVGEDIRSYLNLDDAIIEVDLTPNRSDCLCIKGIAREAGVLNRVAVKGLEIAAVAASLDDTLPISLAAAEACSRYAGRVIRGVDVSRPTPLWMIEKLRRAGIRSIDAVVDITNFVLLEQGQPMHAFDLSTLSGGIKVRMAQEGEPLTLLGGQEVKLNADTLVIADNAKAIAMAGIMGGEETSVTAATQDIFLESAFFNPLAIAGRARKYGLHTDSSHRFERGVDYQIQEQAIERATQLLLDIVGGEAGPLTLAENQQAPQDRQVSLRRERILRGLGFAMADKEVLDILARLGLELLETNADGWTFAVPSYRFDISIESDLLEELARIYGYNNLPVTSMAVPVVIESDDEQSLNLSVLRNTLVARDYFEAICYSFVDESLLKSFEPEAQPVSLQNPISADMSAMRTSLWPGLVTALQYNLNRQHSRVRLFECGLRFVSSDTSVENLVQTPMIAGVIYGCATDESWFGKAKLVDFYDIKADVEALLEKGGQADQFSFTAAKHPALHPGQTAEILKNGVSIGIVGALHPQLQQKLGLAQPAYLFELQQSAVLEAALPSFNALSKFPEVRRDLALVVDQEVAVEELSTEAKLAAGEYLVELKVFDVYVGKGVDTHRKSIALGLTFQHPSRTLNEEEINASIDAVLVQLGEKLNAVQR